MDEVNDFFDFSKPTMKPVVHIEGSQTNGEIQVNDDEIEDIFPSDHRSSTSRYPNVDYVEIYKRNEVVRAMEDLAIPGGSNLDTLEDLSSVGDSEQEAHFSNLVSMKVFSKYKLSQNRKSFAIDSSKTRIIESIMTRSVTIIEGHTGCGKTTQVPQWILEHHFAEKKHCNIYVTQPRRIAAISVARRVCEENSLQLGTLIGYQVGLDVKSSLDTRIQYVTTGILLQKLIANKNMNFCTHIILDEVHERDKEMDFLMIIVKKLLSSNSRNVKVILMSATFDTDKFSSYFSLPNVHRTFTQPGIVSCTGKKLFTAKIYYLDNLNKLGMLPKMNYTENPKITDEMFEFIIKLLNAFELIDTVEENIDEDGENDPRPSVLIFLPGIRSIEELFEILKNAGLREKIDPESAHHEWYLVPLHSSITTEEQAMVFQKAPPGFRKIILATNIAETSITVPDIKYVIDLCLTKLLVSERDTNFTSLQLTWASKGNCLQRAGRAGRLRMGRVYRMIHQQAYENLQGDSVPELQRCPIDSLVLFSKLLNMGSPMALLALAMDPPDLSNIHRTILNLKEIGALLKTNSEGEFSLEDGDITYLGRIMAMLPIDVRLTKLIVLGHIFGCLDDAIIMGAAMAVKSLFGTPFQERFLAYNSKLTWAAGSTSDSIAFLNVYRVRQHLQRQNYFLSKKGGERAWAKQMFLDYNALREMDILVKELKIRLQREGIEEDESQHKTLWSSLEKPLILKVILAGAFYPYYFTFSRIGISEEQDAIKILGGRDFCNTVYLTKMDNRQPGIVYSAFIKDIFKNCSDNIAVNFDTLSSKIYLTFPNMETNAANQSTSIMQEDTKVPGKAVLPVYKALKMRQLQVPMNIPAMPISAAIKHAEDIGLKFENQEWKLNSESDSSARMFKYAMQPKLPDIDQTYADILISHVNLLQCGNFWAQYSDDQAQEQLRWLTHTINNVKGTIVPLTKEPIEGELYAAPFKKEANSLLLYYRARVDKILSGNRVSVFYIDYGNSFTVELKFLKKFDKNIQGIFKINALAFQCTLTELVPSTVMDERSIWTEAACRRFLNLTSGVKLIGKIYSVVHGVASLELFYDDKNINRILVEEGFAQFAEESYLSKSNRNLRFQACNMHPSERNALNKQQNGESQLMNAVNLSPPPLGMCTQTINLKGPFSPLETRVHNLLYSGRDKSVNVTWESVNSVLINTDLQTPHEKMLIAASVSLTSSGNQLMLHHTTVMPNIAGLPVLLALAFCPASELRLNSKQTNYAAVLCGLGHDNGKSLYPEHDILLNIDVEIDNDDLVQVNYLRLTMNSVLMTEIDQMSPMLSDDKRKKTPAKIKTIIEKLTSRQRSYLEPGPVNRPWKWNSVDSNIVTEVQFTLSNRAIFPLHKALIFRKVDLEETTKLAAENAALKATCNNRMLNTAKIVACNLCNTGDLTIQVMRIHLHSRVHRELEKKLLQTED